MTLLEHLKERYDSLDSGDRRLIIIVCTLTLMIVIGYGLVISHLASLHRTKISREQALKELRVLQVRHREAVQNAQRLTNRLANVAPDDSPATIIDQTGIVPKGTMQSKPLPRQEHGAVIEDGAEITLTGLSLNELVNLLYRLEQGVKPVTVKQIAIRTRFSDPAKLDCTLQVALLKNATQAKP